MSTITVSVGVRWWLKGWLCVALVINSATGWRPSQEQIEAVARRAVYIRRIK